MPMQAAAVRIAPSWRRAARKLADAGATTPADDNLFKQFLCSQKHVHDEHLQL
jgi:hypothetical protein